MRLVSFVQVLLLLTIVAYLVLVTLENPGVVRLPLPLGRGEVTLSVGVTVALFTALGGVYATLLLIPPVWRERVRRGREGRARRESEARLVATLQARLGALPPGDSLTVAETAPRTAQAPTPQTPTTPAPTAQAQEQA